MYAVFFYTCENINYKFFAFLVISVSFPFPLFVFHMEFPSDGSQSLIIHSYLEVRVKEHIKSQKGGGAYKQINSSS